MTTFVAPVLGPDVGVMFENVGIAVEVELKVNADGVLTEPLGVVMLTKTAPAAWAGVIAVICEGLTTVRLVAFVPPKVTVLVPVRLVPVMVTLVAPVVGPEEGAALTNVGRVEAVL
jgi:hypothetical protein